MQDHNTTETRTCEWCEKEFTYTPHKSGKGKFCGRDCGRKSRYQRTTVLCEHCQQPFEVPQHRLADNRGKYCSKKCYKATGRGNGVTPQSLEKRFWSKVQKTDSCWLWTGAADRNGYGRIGLGTREEGPALAHRVAYELHNGAITDNLFVCHRCDNPQCVRPDHLFLGTEADNVHDMIDKKRNAHGEKASWSKLTEAQVVEIRQRYAAGGISQAALAREYGLIQTTVGEIVRRVIWKHVP